MATGPQNTDDEEIPIGAIESTLGIERLSICKSGEVTVTSPIADGAASNIPSIEKTDSILMKEQKEEELKLMTPGYEESIEMDLSVLRGIQPQLPPVHEAGGGEGTASQGNSGGAAAGILGGIKKPTNRAKKNGKKDEEDDPDLEALSELVPGLKTGQIGAEAVTKVDGVEELIPKMATGTLPHLDSMAVNQGVDGELNGDGDDQPIGNNIYTLQEEEEGSDNGGSSEESEEIQDANCLSPNTNDLIQNYKGIRDLDESSEDSKSTAGKTHSSPREDKANQKRMSIITAPPRRESTLINAPTFEAENKAPPTNKNMEHPYNTKNYNETPPRPNNESLYGSTPTQKMYNQSSDASMSTATQTQQTNDMKMPMYLPNFRPATGCTNASDFIVRCFAARLRSGITVVKHGRSRWCKSRLRILHVHSDAKSLSWKPAQGEPSTSKRPPKLDLSTCTEVRHAWSPDPLNPMFTGTPILRSKCEASNAFKSFALIFPKRTVDITAVTADQCKVLMEGFSALCYRLQVNSLRGNRPVPTANDSFADNYREKVVTQC